jgi:hypothetical protein
MQCSLPLASTWLEQEQHLSSRDVPQDQLERDFVNVRNLWTLLLYWPETLASGALGKARIGEH